MNAPFLEGPHHFWTHFLIGLVFGLGVGAYLSWGLFDEGWKTIALVFTIALGLALACGRWGDRAWHWMLDRLP